MTSPRSIPGIPAYDMPSEAELPVSRAPWTLAPERAALLIHDMQKYFLRPFGDSPEPLGSLVRNIAALADAARKAGLPVFYTAQEGNQDRRDRGLQAEFWGPGMSRAPEHQDIISELTPEAGDFVLVKHRYSAFQRSNMETLMRVRGRDQLIICGVYAHIGCQLTAAEAFQRDIEPLFVADALGDFSRDKHIAAINWAAATCALVVNTQQILDKLK